MILLQKLIIPIALIFTTLAGQAQSIELELTPAIQNVEVGQKAVFTIKAKGTNGFNDQIFLKISTSNLPFSKNELSTDFISPPYSQTATLSITPFGGIEEKTYSFTVEAFNGTIVVSKSIQLSVKLDCNFIKTSLFTTFIDNKGELWKENFPFINRSSDISVQYKLPNYVYRNKFIDADNNFWFGTDKGLVKFDGKSGTIINSSTNNLPINDINFVIVDSSKSIWIANKKKLYKQSLLKWEEIDLNLPQEQEIIDLKLDLKNDVWVASNAYSISKSILFKISKDKIIAFDNINSCLPSSELFAINIDKNNAIWIGLINADNGTFRSRQNSILKFDGKTWEFWCNKNALPNHILLDNTCKVISSDQSSGFEGDYGDPIFIDENDNKWIRTTGNGGTSLGLTKYNNNTWKKFDKTNSSIDGVISITTSLNSNKVIVNNQFLYEDCDSSPLAIATNISMAANEVIIASLGNNLFQIKSQFSIDRIVLMNINGTEIRTDVAKSNVIDIDYAPYTSGLYLVKIISNNQVVTKKLRVE